MPCRNFAEFALRFNMAPIVAVILSRNKSGVAQRTLLSFRLVSVERQGARKLTWPVNGAVVVSLNRNPLPMKCCHWSNVLTTVCRAPSISNFCCILTDVDSTTSRNSSFPFTFHCITLVPYHYSRAKPKEFEPGNSVITFGLTLREYRHEQTINFKFAFYGYCVKVGVAATNSVIA